MELRLQQLIGLPPQKGYTHFSLLWVDPDDLFRPSPDNEIDDTTVGLSFPENAAEEYQNWFNGNILYSLLPAPLPVDPPWLYLRLGGQRNRIWPVGIYHPQSCEGPRGKNVFE